MFVYHGVWFASEAGLVDIPIRRHPGWVTFQKTIAGSFFALVGVGLHLGAPARRRPVLRRLGRLLGCATVVTLTSLVLDPSRVVTFGILHSIALCSVVALPFVSRPTSMLLTTGLVLVGLGLGLRLDAFDHPGLHWTGLSPRVPPTFDHQPFLPWFGVVLLGIGLGRVLPRAMK